MVAYRQHGAVDALGARAGHKLVKAALWPWRQAGCVSAAPRPRLHTPQTGRHSSAASGLPAVPGARAHGARRAGAARTLDSQLQTPSTDHSATSGSAMARRSPNGKYKGRTTTEDSKRKKERKKERNHATRRAEHGAHQEREPAAGMGPPVPCGAGMCAGPAILLSSSSNMTIFDS